MSDNKALMRVEFNPEQVELIKKQIAPQANDMELKLFLYQCQRTGLDPMTRQIYCIHRGGKMTIQTSIDGFRVIAQRSGDYAGQDEPVWEYEGKAIKKCTVKVYRFNGGNRYCAGVGVAFWSEYAQQSPMWNKMGHTMIAKCAEALALRKAFPQDLSGLYTGEEMSQADQPQQVNEDGFGNMPTPEERRMLVNLVYSSTLEDDKKEETIEWILTKCNDYKLYEQMHTKLEMVQPSIDEIPNPSQKDINKHLRETVA